MIRRCSLSLREEDADWKTIKALQEKVFVEEDRIQVPLKTQVWWVANFHRKPVGFSALTQAVSNEGYKYAFLPLIGILPAYRGKGLFSQLVRGAIKHCSQNDWKKIVTYVHPLNGPSLNAFVKEGFKFYTPEALYVGDKFTYLYLTI